MNLFAYGTLMWPEVLEAVIGRRLSGASVSLCGFLRIRMKGELYPALIDAQARDEVEGILYRGLTEAEFRHLDRFEGGEYDRREVCIGTEKVYVMCFPAAAGISPIPVHGTPRICSKNTSRRSAENTGAGTTGRQRAPVLEGCPLPDGLVNRSAARAPAHCHRWRTPPGRFRWKPASWHTDT